MVMFYEYAQSDFIGQGNILKELSVFAEGIKKGENVNLLFEAPSGHGKTTLANLFFSFLNPGFPDCLRYVPSQIGEINFNPQKRFQFFDEAHLLKSPEFLYPYFDSEVYTNIVATNYYDELKEPMRNRCIRLQFSPYSDLDLAWILYNLFLSKRIGIPFDWCKELVGYSRGNPRELKNLGKRLVFVFKVYGVFKELSHIHNYIYEVLGTKEGGFTTLDEEYIKCLKLCGGTASLRTLLGMTKIPRRTILEEIEPFLIVKGLIQITSKGRKLL